MIHINEILTWDKLTNFKENYWTKIEGSNPTISCDCQLVAECIDQGEGEEEDSDPYYRVNQVSEGSTIDTSTPSGNTIISNLYYRPLTYVTNSQFPELSKEDSVVIYSQEYVEKGLKFDIPPFLVDCKEKEWSEVAQYGTYYVNYGDSYIIFKTSNGCYGLQTYQKNNYFKFIGESSSNVSVVGYWEKNATSDTTSITWNSSTLSTNGFSENKNISGYHVVSALSDQEISTLAKPTLIRVITKSGSTRYIWFYPGDTWSLTSADYISVYKMELVPQGFQKDQSSYRRFYSYNTGTKQWQDTNWLNVNELVFSEEKAYSKDIKYDYIKVDGSYYDNSYQEDSWSGKTVTYITKVINCYLHDSQSLINNKIYPTIKSNYTNSNSKDPTDVTPNFYKLEALNIIPYKTMCNYGIKQDSGKSSVRLCGEWYQDGAGRYRIKDTDYNSDILNFNKGKEYIIKWMFEEDSTFKYDDQYIYWVRNNRDIIPIFKNSYYGEIKEIIGVSPTIKSCTFTQIRYRGGESSIYADVFEGSPSVLYSKPLTTSQSQGFAGGALHGVSPWTISGFSGTGAGSSFNGIHLNPIYSAKSSHFLSDYYYGFSSGSTEAEAIDRRGTFLGVTDSEQTITLDKPSFQLNLKQEYSYQSINKNSTFSCLNTSSPSKKLNENYPRLLQYLPSFTTKTGITPLSLTNVKFKTDLDYSSWEGYIFNDGDSNTFNLQYTVDTTDENNYQLNGSLYLKTGKWSSGIWANQLYLQLNLTENNQTWKGGDLIGDKSVSSISPISGTSIAYTSKTDTYGFSKDTVYSLGAVSFDTDSKNRLTYSSEGSIYPKQQFFIILEQ